VASGRHKLVVESQFRRRLVRIAAPVSAATLVTGTVVSIAVAGGNGGQQLPQATPTPIQATLAAPPAELADRFETASRSSRRVTLQAKPDVKRQLFMTADLNLWPTPAEKGDPIDVLPAGDKVGFTGVVRNGFAQILHRGQVRWVNNDYLTAEKPVEQTAETAETAEAGGTATGAVSGAPCVHGSSIESGLTSGAIAVYRAVCAAFPSVSSYGGWRGDGEHSDGRAIDIMVSGDLGWQIANWLVANSARLSLYDVIYAQRIWTDQRSSEGWRPMEDRGSTTANHYDHVHVKAY
jgi:hypothetical protein